MEYAAGIFLSIIGVAVLVNLRAGTLRYWMRAKFLNLGPGQGIAPQAAPGKAFDKPGVTTPATKAAPGANPIATIKNAVAARFADDITAGRLVIKGGVTNCRPMKPQPRGISWVAYSEHSWSNAWDLYYGDRPRKYVDQVVAWLKAEKAAGRLPVGSIIRYGANGSHVHIEGSPKRNPRPYKNIPPCASRSSLAP